MMSNEDSAQESLDKKEELPVCNQQAKWMQRHKEQAEAVAKRYNHSFYNKEEVKLAKK